MTIPVVPIFLGRGKRLWDGLSGADKLCSIESPTSPTGVMPGPAP